MSEFTVFHQSEASLAEGLYVDNANQQLFWVDINKSVLHRKSCDSQHYRQYFLDDIPSAVIRLRGSILTVCTAQGLAELDIETGALMLISVNPDTGYNRQFRSNDGVALGDESVIYGTMEISPTGTTGGLYFYDGNTTCSLNCSIGIPNGFIRLNETEILIADSYTKLVNLYKVDRKNLELHYERCWCNFSAEKFTPDGGCVDEYGNVYVALWDGCGIAVLNSAGDFLRVLDLPAPRPTNCKIAEDGKLYVTSARDGLTVEQLKKYPLSGSIFEIDLK